VAIRADMFVRRRSSLWLRGLVLVSISTTLHVALNNGLGRILWQSRQRRIKLLALFRNSFSIACE